MLNTLSPLSRRVPLAALCLLLASCTDPPGRDTPAGGDQAGGASAGAEGQGEGQEGEGEGEGEEGEGGAVGGQEGQGQEGHEGVAEGDEGHEGDAGQEGDEGQDGGEGHEGADGQEGGEGHEGDAGQEGAEGHEGDAGQEGGEGHEGEEGPEGGEGHEGEEGPEGGEGHEGEEGLEGGEGHEGDEGGGEVGEEDPCPGMHRDRCIESQQCVLELIDENAGYLCRRAEGACEPHPTGEECQADPRCEWEGGSCYCPEGLQCFCGGGPPPICRNRAESCDARVGLRKSGGLCQEGACFQQTEIQGQDYIVFDDETARTPLYAQLPDDRIDPIDAALADALALDLDDAYGECCNAHFDGSDSYVAFFVDGDPVQEVRVSDRELAPAALTRLIDLLSDAGRSLLERNAEGPRCEADR